MKRWKKRFILLCGGQAASMLTSSVLQMSIVWHLTQRTGSPVIVTLSTLAGFLPRTLLGLFTGVLVDRFDRKKIIILSDLAIALAAVALALAALFGEVPLWFIFFILCARSAGAAFHTPAFNAVVPSLVPPEHLTRCAGITQGFESTTLILSPALAAVLYNMWNFSAVILLDVAGAIIAVCIVWLTAIPQNRADDTRALHIWRDTKEGLSVLRGERGMTALLAISTLYAFFYFPIGSLYPVITMTYFGGSVADSAMVEMAFFSGMLGGSLLLGLAAGRLTRKIRAISVSIGVYGAGALATGLLPPNALRPFVALSALMGLTLPFFYGLRTAAFQSRIPSQYLGRVLSLLYSVSLFAAPLGLLLGGAFSEAAGVNVCFAVCGALSICLSIVTLLLPSVRNSGV